MQTKRKLDSRMENLLDTPYTNLLDYDKRCVTISSSMRFRKEINNLRRLLKANKISHYYPQIVFGQSKKKIAPTFKKLITLNFFRKIDNSDFLYILNVNSYIGSSVMIEIGYAFAQKKVIIAKEEVKDPDISPLISNILNFEDFIYYINKKCEL